MNKSFYAEYADKYFGNLVLSIVERLNEKRTNALTYLYRDMLVPTFSADGTWQSIIADYTRVAADVVALDSELPLKSRDSIEVAHGYLPKLGMKLFLTEKQMDDLDTMLAKGLPINQVIQAMFADVPRCIEGIYERIEEMFLAELSSGVAITNHNVGTGVRLDIGYLDANKFTAIDTVWKNDVTGAYNSDALILDDMEQIFDKALADQNTITDIFCDDYALRAMYRNNQFKQQYAFNQDFVGSNIPTLDFDKAAQVVMTKWGATLHRVARKIKTEVNGIKRTHSPWAEGRIIFTCSPVVGNLVYGNLAENSRRVANVTYQEADNFILASRYSDNDPLREFTSAQAKVVPIIQNVDQIYSLDPKNVQG